MKLNKNYINLGSAKIAQKTIDNIIDIKKIIEILLDNINILEDLIEESPNEFKKEIYNSLKFKKNLPLRFNKHIEIFILNSLNDIKKIFNYIEFRYKFELCGKKKINLGFPPYLLIEPVSTCNLRCHFCFQTDKSFTKKPFMGVMKFELFKEIIDEAESLGVGAITIASRGEPTMHKRFEDMLNYIGNKKFFETKINSNGSFLNESICHSIFQNNITQVVISADHYEKEKFEKLRLNSEFEKIVTNVDLLYNIRKNYYENSVTEIRISGIDADNNLDKKKFKDFWIKRSDHVTASLPLERWDTYNNKIDNDINDPCENLWDRMYIWFDGKVNPCDADYKSYLSYGDKKKNSIKEIWNSNHINNIRNDHLNNKRITHTPCNKCGVTFI